MQIVCRPQITFVLRVKKRALEVREVQLVSSQEIVRGAGMIHEYRALPPDHLRPVLEQLLIGATDTVASRRLRMSPRTYSRRVAELLEYLGVSSRFQGGAEIAARGWLPRRRA
jgi:hypothetical protein